MEKNIQLQMCKINKKVNVIKIGNFKSKLAFFLDY